MLFSQQSVFDSSLLRRILALTTMFHLVLLGVIFLCESLFVSTPLMFSVKTPASPVSLLSRYRGKGSGIGGALGKSKKGLSKQDPLPQAVPQKEMIPAPQEKTSSQSVVPQVKSESTAKKEVPKASEKPVEQKKTPEQTRKKEPQKKKELLLPKNEKKQALPKKETQKTQPLKKLKEVTPNKGAQKKQKNVPESQKKTSSKEVASSQQVTQKKQEPLKKQNVAKQPEKLIESTLTTNVLSQRLSNESDQIELPQQGQYRDGDGPAGVEFGGSGGMIDGVVQEFARHFTLPPGFDDTEAFNVTFEIREGKVMNVSPHGKESLVVYTAVKDALLKSSMPRGQNRKITLLIT